MCPYADEGTVAVNDCGVFYIVSAADESAIEILMVMVLPLLIFTLMAYLLMTMLMLI